MLYLVIKADWNISNRWMVLCTHHQWILAFTRV